MINGLELNIFWLENEEQINQMEMGLEINVSDLETKPIMFFTIDHVRPSNEFYCTIVSGSFEYLVNQPYEVVLAKIQERLTFKLN